MHRIQLVALTRYNFSVLGTFGMIFRIANVINRVVVKVILCEMTPQYKEIFYEILCIVFIFSIMALFIRFPKVRFQSINPSVQIKLAD